MRNSPVSSMICFQTMMRLWYYLELWDKDFLSDADGAPNILKALEKTRSRSGAEGHARAH